MMEMITKEDCEEVLTGLDNLLQQYGFIQSVYTPILNGERYLSAQQVCKSLNICKRTLQEYRDSRLLDYISLPGKTLYRESDILKVLEENYVSRLTY